VPSLDLRLADNKSLVDAVTGASLVTFTRASAKTVTNSARVLETVGIDVPAFDHNPTTGESLGLLVEEQRTNSLLNSATLSTQSVTVAAAANTLSFYGTGTVTLTGVSTAGPLVGTGANDRVSLTFTPIVGVLILTVSGSVTNAQLEAGAFPTSYIPTTTAAVTRSADVCSITGSAFSSWYRQNEGTMLFSGKTAPVNNIAQLAFDISEGVGSDRIFSRRNTAGFVATGTLDGGVTQGGDLSSAAAIAGGASYVSAYAFAANNIGNSVNASAPGSITTAVMPTVDRIHIGQNFSSGQHFNGTIRRICFWPQRLANSTLQQITQ
jgi:hypothetical protein